MPCGGGAARLLGILVKNRCFLTGSLLLQAPQLPGGFGKGEVVAENLPCLPGVISRKMTLDPFRARTWTLTHQLAWHFGGLFDIILLATH